MRVIEQLKDNYGNLIMEWGIFEVVFKINTTTTYPKKKVTKRLISSHYSLSDAELALGELE